jgi:hypothetical protein
MIVRRHGIPTCCADQWAAGPDNPHDAVNRHVWGTRQSRRFFGSTGGFAV